MRKGIESGYTPPVDEVQKATEDPEKQSLIEKGKAFVSNFSIGKMFSVGVAQFRLVTKMPSGAEVEPLDIDGTVKPVIMVPWTFLSSAEPLLA